MESLVETLRGVPNATAKEAADRIEELESLIEDIQSMDADINGASLFICWLVDNAEGETITEEYMQACISEFIKWRSPCPTQQ